MADKLNLIANEFVADRKEPDLLTLILSAV